LPRGRGPGGPPRRATSPGRFTGPLYRVTSPGRFTEPPYSSAYRVASLCRLLCRLTGAAESPMARSASTPPASWPRDR